MNLIDYEVTAVLSSPVHRTYQTSGGEILQWWEVQIEYTDDGGAGQIKNEIFFTEESANECEVGMIYQH